MHSTEHMWHPESSLWESVLSFHYPGPKDRSQVHQAWWQVPLLVKPHAHLCTFKFFKAHFQTMALKHFNLPSSPPSTRGSRKEQITGEVDLFKSGSLEQIPSVLSGNQQFQFTGQQPQINPLANISWVYQQSRSVSQDSSLRSPDKWNSTMQSVRQPIQACL